MYMFFTTARVGINSTPRGKMLCTSILRAANRKCNMLDVTLNTVITYYMLKT